MLGPTPIGFMDGEGRPHSEKPKTGGACITVVEDSEFRIGWDGQQVAKLLLHLKGGPWVRHRIEYKLCCDGAHDIKFKSSVFPAQKAYVAGREVGHHKPNHRQIIHGMLGGADVRLSGSINL